MNTPTSQDIERIEARLIEVKTEIAEKAGTDATFHDALVANPKATIEQAYSLAPGSLDDLNISIFVEPSQTIGIVIPARPSSDGDELSEEQLEAVAGGAVFCAAIGAALITATGAVTVGAMAATGAVAAAGINSGWGKK